MRPAFAEAERDGIRERIGQVKADQKARGRYLGGIAPFGFCVADGALVPNEGEQEAVREHFTGPTSTGCFGRRSFTTRLSSIGSARQR
jgi:DNA invertase Pin-like site-specific DNA recombinase